MQRFTILLGGLVTPTERLKAQVAGSRVIAADSGMRHAQALGLAAELWVGDFDSASPELQQAYAQVPREVHPAAKDFTDGELAVQAALARGAEQLVLVGAMGGQTDQTLAHLLLGIRLAQQGVPTLLTSGNEEAHPLLPGILRLNLPPHSRLSLLPLGGFSGLSLRGTRWSLHRASVPLGSTQTLSNLALGPVEIELEAGYGVVVAYPEPATL
ncbi:thiamine diphosphokinase [Meiothermus taiwanensis]|uniref:Thiamine diphosphokinase n=2 Tax=Meiothermus taiwanensis TaxID=172827 RepID=A0A399E6Z3_9DEIN|nr:thiamine diphosphokinase [Meiothermus taiwanensis]AWR87613.1 thiamine pyrophosphokinase [Meiothermus taiwanensis WR-220]KIQ55092.1 thiamine pyrophosphokinase [Meiothermus taiwanensis]KZK16728.1 thiamine pyrophosphokinase [Meiothermus taiwanensis]RIH79283.1 Thiamine pyrophosphokinase [Meiothermus taiwanensis]